MLLRKMLVLTALATPSFGLHAQGAFTSGCTLPFDSIRVPQDIDRSCGLNGAPGASTGSHLQNAVKNNFCAKAAGGNPPETVTIQSLVTLQGRTHVPSGYQREPTNRAPLQLLGEGKLVRIKGFVLDAHHADLGSGESVNCNGADALHNDVHIALVAQATGGQECESVTAEISPHFRPNSWNILGDDEAYNSSTHLYTPDPTIEAKLNGHPFRIIGQLFFDASHQVCPCGSPNTCKPSRSSLWEIHPVYAIEVCAAGTSCDETRDTDWIAFDTWWAGNPAPGPAPATRPPHTHTPHDTPPHRPRPKPAK